MAQMSVTPTGDIVAASASGGLPAIWNVDARMMPINGITTFASSVDVSPDGAYIALGLQDATISLIRTADQSLVNIGRGHGHAVTGVAFSPSGVRIASVSLDRTVRIWKSPSLEPFATYHGHDRGIWHVKFSNDGSRLATLSQDQTIRIWDARRQGGRSVLKGHEGFVYGLAFTREGSRLATAGWDRSIRLWDTTTADQIELLTVDANVVTALSFSADGRYISWVGEDSWGAWDLQSKSPVIPASDAPPSPTASVRRFDFVEDAPVVPLPWTLNDGDVKVWNVATNAIEEWTFEELRKHRAPFLGGQGGRFAVGIVQKEATDDIRTARGDSGSLLSVVDLDRGKPVQLPEFSGPFALGPSGLSATLLAARRADDLSSVEVWNLEARQLVGRLVGHTDSIYAIAYSPDGKRIATGGRDSLRLWDAETFTEIVQLRGHTSFIWSLAFSPDGRQLVSGSGDKTARIWDAPSRGLGEHN